MWKVRLWKKFFWVGSSFLNTAGVSDLVRTQLNILYRVKGTPSKQVIFVLFAQRVKNTLLPSDWVSWNVQLLALWFAHFSAQVTELCFWAFLHRYPDKHFTALSWKQRYMNCYVLRVPKNIIFFRLFEMEYWKIPVFFSQKERASSSCKQLKAIRCIGNCHIKSVSDASYSGNFH